ncbi:MAG: hypothetical protein WCI04_02440 [archaeon]
MNTFDIAIYAVAALALIFVFFAVIQPLFGPQNHLKEIQNSLLNAQISTNLGKTIYIGTLTYANDATILTSSFDKTKILVAIECTSPTNCCARRSEQKTSCKKAIDWDYTFFNSNELKSIPTYVRCIKLSELPVCKIYFGGTPAQAQIQNTELTSTTNDATGITVTLNNTGSLPIAGATNSVKLLKRGPEGWTETDYSIPSKSLDLLNSEEEIIINWELTPQNLGEYRAVFKFESENSGFDTKTIDFNKTTNDYCTATTKGNTLFESDNNSYRELRNCTGCNYAHECVAVWNSKEAGKLFLPETKDAAYCAKQSYEGSC